MLPVDVQRFVAGSYSSAVRVYAPPPATRTRPSSSRTAAWSQRGVVSVPPALQAPVAGSYSSVDVCCAPPTTSTRPFASRVAVRPSRGVAILWAADHVPVGGRSGAVGAGVGCGGGGLPGLAPAGGPPAVDPVVAARADAAAIHRLSCCIWPPPGGCRPR